MLAQLENRKVLFFDVGYTLDRPASGDWMFTNRFLREAGGKMQTRSREEISRAREAGLRFLTRNHRISTVEEECDQFYRYYSILSDQLDLGLSEEQRRAAAWDRTYNMENYIPYPGVREVLETLSRTHQLGVISDTWPSVEMQLEHIGVSRYFSFRTFSCELGVFKPDARMYRDALNKSGVSAAETAFIDDSAKNLAGAAALGILPILIAADPRADAETAYLRIKDLGELIRRSAGKK